ncbi:MAG: hypothetical protein EBY32_17350, partial [Proteobacteria bacterium]|nr:hypothetical protein [Pseudomonadota bacterium]
MRGPRQAKPLCTFFCGLARSIRSSNPAPRRYGQSVNSLRTGTPCSARHKNTNAHTPLPCSNASATNS